MTLTHETPKLDGVNYGLCRVYYKRNQLNYCFQEEFPGVFSFYRCCQEGEPSHLIPLNSNFLAGLPVPDEEGKWYDGFRSFIKKQKELHYDTPLEV